MLVLFPDVYHLLKYCTSKFVYKAYGKLIILKKNHNKVVNYCQISNTSTRFFWEIQFLQFVFPKILISKNIFYPQFFFSFSPQFSFFAIALKYHFIHVVVILLLRRLSFIDILQFKLCVPSLWQIMKKIIIHVQRNHPCTLDGGSPIRLSAEFMSSF